MFGAGRGWGRTCVRQYWENSCLMEKNTGSLYVMYSEVSAIGLKT